jgi:Txe/YoeB family toxin of Txe-Axe toxin-antitoxin module
MKIKPVKDEVVKYIRKHQLEKKFQKAIELFERDTNHPSLNVELLEPKYLKVYSFRIDKKYRAAFVVIGNEIEIITVTIIINKVGDRFL